MRRFVICATLTHTPSHSGGSRPVPWRLLGSAGRGTDDVRRHFCRPGFKAVGAEGFARCVLPSRLPSGPNTFFLGGGGVFRVKNGFSRYPVGGPIVPRRPALLWAVFRRAREF